MLVKLFLLGLPGSGKSTVARYIQEYVKKWDWSTIHFGDYEILKRMFQHDIEVGGRQFKRAEYGGFDMLDVIVFDIALKELEQHVEEHMHTVEPKEMVLIEFARGDYHWAFRQFSYTFVRDAYLLYLDTKIDICKQRIFNRVADPATGDDYFVSDYIFETYYSNIKPILWSDLIAEFEFDRQKVKFVDNNGSLQDIIPQITDFVDSIYRSS